MCEYHSEKSFTLTMLRQVRPAETLTETLQVLQISRSLWHAICRRMNCVDPIESS